MTTIDAGTNPQLANQMLDGALRSSNSAPSGGLVVPPIEPPPERAVTLFAGIVDPMDGSVRNEALVRELTGADEEALTSPSLARSIPKYLSTMVLRGTESIGDEKPSKDVMGDLLIGDRELLLLAIRKATYGTTLELITTCAHCEARDEDYVFDLNSLEVKALDMPPVEAVFGFEVTLPSGRKARVALPTAKNQDDILEATTAGEGELNTMMLVRTVRELDEQPVLGAGPVKALTIRDRQAILKVINERTPGPQIGKAKRTCGACEQEFDLNLGLLDLFRA